MGFFVKQEGKLTFVLGGNQNDEINITGYRMNPVGYRWPTRFNHLLTQPSNTATA